MGMPDNLILVRHGESDGNVTTHRAKSGDLSGYSEAFVTTPGSQWRLTDRGRSQAETIGQWLRAAVYSHDQFPGFDDRFYVSPYVRARETAGLLGLPGARWRINRALRERDWGDIGSMPRGQFETDPRYAENARLKHIDPLYWVAPNGESIAMVAEDRVRNFLDTLHREQRDDLPLGGNVTWAVGHGEMIEAFMLTLERLTDEEFVRREHDRSFKIHNGMAVWFTRIDPFESMDVKRSPHLKWARRVYPVQTATGFEVEVEPWRSVDFHTFSNDELLAQVERVPPLTEATCR